MRPPLFRYLTFPRTPPSAVWLLPSLLTTSAAFAAGDAGQVLRQEQELRSLQQAPAASAPARLAAPPPGQGTGPRVHVNTFRVAGNAELIPQERVDQVLVDYAGKDLSFLDIQNAAALVSAELRARGHFLARATIPQQDVTDGVVQLVIVEGRLDKKQPVRVQGNNLRLRQERLQGTIQAALGDAMLITGLERGILNINDNPGIASTATLEPGSEDGATRVVLDVTEGPRVNGLVSLDNFGSRLTGKNRVSALVNVNDPLAIGDQFQFSAIGAPGKRFGLGRIAYSLPLGLSGLRGGISYSDLAFAVGQELAVTTPQGKARDLSLFVRYPIFRSGLSGLYVGATWDHKTSYNEELGIPVSDKRDDVATLGITAEHTDTLAGGGFTQLQWVGSAGRMDLGRVASALAADQGTGGPRVDGSFRKHNLSFTRIQHGTDRLSFQLLASGQVANRNLDSLEKFPFGGPTGVRAYPSEEGYGDEGLKTSLEARYTLVSRSKVGDVLASLFYDRGRVRQYAQPGLLNLTTPNLYTLAGWGVALDLVAADKYAFKLIWARPIGSNPAADSNGNNADGRPNRARVWAMANINF